MLLYVSLAHWSVPCAKCFDRNLQQCCQLLFTHSLKFDAQLEMENDVGDSCVCEFRHILENRYLTQMELVESVSAVKMMRAMIEVAFARCTVLLIAWCTKHLDNMIWSNTCKNSDDKSFKNVWVQVSTAREGFRTTCDKWQRPGKTMMTTTHESLFGTTELNVASPSRNLTASWTSRGHHVSEPETGAHGITDNDSNVCGFLLVRKAITLCRTHLMYEGECLDSLVSLGADEAEPLMN